MQKKCTAIILAAGHGSRMHSSTPKQFMEIAGRPILYYSLRCFEDAALISDIILVTGEESIEYCQDEIVAKYGFKKVAQIVAGGKERYHSVYQGLLSCENTEYVFIHDSARAMIDEEIIIRGYHDVIEHLACAAAVPSKDTVKITDENGIVQSTPVRDNTWLVQTPQVFSYPLIRTAYEKALGLGLPGITDDAMVVEQCSNVPVHLFMGSYSNIKITTPEDIKLAEKSLEKK